MGGVIGCSFETWSRAGVEGAVEGGADQVGGLLVARDEVAVLVGGGLDRGVTRVSADEEDRAPELNSTDAQVCRSVCGDVPVGSSSAWTTPRKRRCTLRIDG
jgi:hypothetical protein